MVELPGGTPFYPNVCQYCQRDIVELKKCSSCKTAAYCSKEHQKSDWPSHRKLCKALRNLNENIPYQVDNYRDFASYKAMLTMGLEAVLGRDLEPYEVTVCNNLMVCEVCWKREGLFECAECKSVWFCCKEHEEENARVHQNYCKDLRLCRLSDLYREEVCLEDLRINTYTSIIKTVTYALERVGFNLETLNLHVVGAFVEEAKSIWDFSNIQLKFPRLQNINLYFIGPELIPIEPPEKIGVDVQVYNHARLYHEVVNDLAKPDMIALFNPGLHADRDYKDDLWKPSIAHFFKNIPILLTGYSKQENEKDRDVLLSENNACEIVVDCMENPFSGKKPFRDWEQRYTSVFFANRYICICKGSKESTERQESILAVN